MPRIGLTPQTGIAASLLFAGLLLRLYFLRFHSFLAGDSLLYQEIAQNWIHAHTYGLSTDTAPRPTLIRLPGYPLILAALAILFDPLLKADPGTLRSFLPVLFLQIAIDLFTCVLIASLAGNLFGARARITALAIACLCPFTANYTAVPLTETFTNFTVALAFVLLLRWLRQHRTRDLLLLATTLSFSILLRPDQALLTLAIFPVLLIRQDPHGNRRWRSALLCAVLISLPFVPWTIRNARTFHIFQPIAPRLANDPGEAVPRGFQRWFRTFAVDFSSTEDAYWKYPEEPVNANNLPRRAFDTPAQEEQTRDLLHEAAAYNELNPGLDARFAALAQDRIASHPLRYYIALPVARLVNMLLHPRVEMLPVDDRWWQYRRHPSQTFFSLCYAALNAALLLAAIVALPKAWRRAPAITGSMCAYTLLRCALLLTLDNAEQRYTIEFLPLWIVLAGTLAAPSRILSERPLPQTNTGQKT